LHHIKKSN